MLAVDVRPRPAAPGHALAAVLRATTEAKDGDGGVVKIVPVPAGLASAPCVAQKPKSVAFSDWISEAMGRCRGVMAAFPRELWPAADPAAADPFAAATARIVMLDQGKAVGRNWWWLWALKGTEFDSERHYALDDSTVVYRTDGLEGSEWFPDANAYDAAFDADYFELASLAGFAVSVRHVPPPFSGGSAATLSDVPALGQRVLLELEAAACGSGPAVFGCMLVHDADAFGALQGQAKLAASAEAGVAADTSGSSRIVACVTVSQTHSYRLSDMLYAYNNVTGDPLLRPRVSVAAFDSTVYEGTLSIARKVRYLARARILKLNVTPDTVVFCPRLVESDAGEVEATGFGFLDPDKGEAVKGTPLLWDFDPVYTKRIASSNQDYDADCAYAVMMLVLLASVRAQYGEVYRVMMHRVTGRSPEGADLPAGELPEDYAERIDLGEALTRVRLKNRFTFFCALLRSVLPAFAKDREASLGAAYASVALDFADVVRSAVLEKLPAGNGGQVFDPARPVFEQLVRYLTTSDHADTAVFLSSRSPAEVLASRERIRREEQRLAAVRLERQRRLLSAVAGRGPEPPLVDDLGV